MTPERIAELRALADALASPLDADAYELSRALTEVLDAFEAVVAYGLEIHEQSARVHADFLAAIEQRNEARARLAQLRADIELPALPTVRGYIRGGKVVDLPCIYRRGVWAVVHPWDSRLERVSTVALILLHVPTGLGPGTTHLWTADDRDDAINKVRTLHERYPDFAADAQLGDRPDIPPELVRLIFDSEEYA